MQGRGQAEVEEGEGGGATRQGSDPLSCLLAAPWTNLPQVQHPQVLGPQEPQDPMCFGEARGHGEHPPLREACPHPILVCSCRSARWSPWGRSTARVGVCVPVGGLSNRPAVWRAWWAQGWQMGDLCH